MGLESRYIIILFIYIYIILYICTYIYIYKYLHINSTHTPISHADVTIHTARSGIEVMEM